jgi:hypothetical protein
LSLRRSHGLVLLALLVGLPACGWRAGLSLPAGVQHVGVEVFEADRDVLERGLEPLFTQEISRALIDRVGAPIEAPSRADVILRGRILEYRRRPGIRNSDNQLLETGIYVRASAELVDRRTGRIVVPVKETHVWSGYSTDLSLENEQIARERALRHVADSLVLDLFRPTTVGASDAATDGAESAAGAR